MPHQASYVLRFLLNIVHGMRRYYHPAPPSKTIKTERTFEGISLETPGSGSGKSVQAMSRFQLCHLCYQREANALNNPNGAGKAKGLPSGISLQDLRCDVIDELPAIKDSIGDIDCEFFDTRQASPAWLF